jgi:predicted Zn-dependent protease
MRKRKLVNLSLVFVFLCLATTSFADKIKGYIWDIQGTTVVVEGVAFSIPPNVKIERKKHKGIRFQDLQIGWEVEVEGKQQGERFLVKKLKVKNERYDDIKIEGFVVEVNESHIDVDGHHVRWPPDVNRNMVVPGIRIKGKGIIMDDGTIELKEAEILPRGFDQGETEFMTMAKQEIGQLKQQIEPFDNPELQDYVSRIGQNLVPAWIDPNEFKFNFTVIDDPTLNAFALPDGTVVIHTGLIAVLENEAQLATVIGHEIAHATHRHGYRGYKNAQKMSWVQLGAMVAGAVVDTQTNSAIAETLVGLGSGLAISAAVNGHGRNLEDDADRIGLHYMVDAGYDPFEAPVVWHRFNEHVQDQSAVTNWFFSDHSTHKARISNLTREINAHYREGFDRSSYKTYEKRYLKMAEPLRRRTAVQDYHRKEYKNAAKYFSQSLEKDPNDAVAHLYMGKIILDTGGPEAADRALEAYKTAARLEPKYAEPYREIGLLYYRVENHQAAVRAFETYLQMEPDAPEGQQIRTYIAKVRR